MCHVMSSVMCHIYATLHQCCTHKALTVLCFQEDQNKNMSKSDHRSSADGFLFMNLVIKYTSKFFIHSCLIWPMQNICFAFLLFELYYYLLYPFLCEKLVFILCTDWWCLFFQQQFPCHMCVLYLLLQLGFCECYGDPSRVCHMRMRKQCASDFTTLNTVVLYIIFLNWIWLKVAYIWNMWMFNVSIYQIMFIIQ